MPSHHFHQKHAFHRRSSIPDLVDGVECGVDGGIVADCDFGAVDVAVDGSGQSDDGKAGFLEQVMRAVQVF